jgi:DNA-binding CsgD family transcriptional regulator
VSGPPSLARWGISPDADLVYRLLDGFGARTAAQAAHELGMSPRRVAAAIEELRAAGAVLLGANGSGRRAGQFWIAVPPAEVIRLLRCRRLSMADPIEQARAHLSTVSALAVERLAGAAAGEVRHLPGRDRTRQRIADLVAVERHEHLAINPEQAFSAETMAAALPLDRSLLARGVRYRSLGLPPADGDRLDPHTPELRELGARYRYRDVVPLKLMVFDRRVALLPLDPLDLGRGALEIAAPAAVQALVALFEGEWDAATDPLRAGVAPIMLTRRERAVIGLLAGGHTDPSAARELGLSLRTVGYVVRELMDRLQVDNRFQLGLALGRRRAVPAPGDPRTARLRDHAASSGATVPAPADGD